MKSKFKIDLFIAGAQKCGTTSIKEYFREHPQVKSHVQTEMTYYSLNEEFEKGDEYCSKHYFEKEKTSKFFVAKHATFTRSEESVKRLYDANPDCKILFFVRNPIRRAYSSYLMEVRNGSITCTFDEAVKLALKSTPGSEYRWFYNVFLGLGFYVDHLDVLTRYFSKHQIKVVDIESFKKDEHGIMNDIFEWVGLSSFSVNANKIHNEGGKAKFAWFGNLIKRKSIVKSLLKAILSPKIRAKLSLALTELNTDRSSSPTVQETGVSVEVVDLLKKLFADKNRELEEKWGIKLAC